MKILALDFEGTNKEPRRGCPIQLGVAVMDGEEVLAQEEWIIRPPVHYKTGKPTREVDAYSLRVSGLSLEKIEAEGFTSLEVCADLDQWVTTNKAQALPVVAFNFSYDNECYRQLLFDAGSYYREIGEYLPYNEILAHRWECASSLARRLLCQHLTRFSLDNVAEFFGLSRSSECHGALEDAILAGRIYAKLVEMIVNRRAA